MEGDYWAKTYGRYAKSVEREPSIEDAQNMELRELVAFLNDAIPKYADEDSSDLQYMLRMAKAAADDLLSGRRRKETQ